MPDYLSDEDTRTAFAELRASELAGVRPPGTDSIRRTVRRRTAARVVAAVGCAALAIAGGAVVAADVLAPAPNAVGQGVGSRSRPTERPTAVPTDALGWGRLADAALRWTPDEPRWFAHSFGPADASNHGVSYVGAYPAYTMTVACAGAGTVHVRIAADTHAAFADVACGATFDDAVAGTVELVLRVGSTATHDLLV